MGRASPALRGIANSGPERSFQNTESSLPSNSLLMRVARSLWPLKTDLALAERTGASDRMCRYWLASKYSLSADDVCDLLRSDDGLQFLEAIMGDAKPIWWKRMKASANRAALRRAQKVLQKQIDQMEMELEA